MLKSTKLKSMKTIQLKNIRSLVDTGPLNLAPITLLLGQNSSGKSTVLRTIPLLKQALGIRTRGPFLWDGELVDFGSFEETHSKFAANNFVSLSFEFDIPFYDALQSRGIYRTLRSKEGASVPLSVEIGEVSGSGNTQNCFKYKITIGTDEIFFRISSEGRFLFLSINQHDYTKLVENRLEIKEWTGPIPTPGIIAGETQLVESTKVASFRTELFQFIKRRSHGKTRAERVDELARILTNFPFSNLLAVSRRTAQGDTQWKKHSEEWTTESEEFQTLRRLVLGSRLHQILGVLSDYFSDFLYRVRYIKPLRASAERYYRKQGLAVDEVDPQGENFALFLHNMTATEKRSFSEWSAEYFGLWIEVRETGGHLSLVLNADETAGHDFNMADTGFGYSQMFPILAQLWSIRRAEPNPLSRLGAPAVFAIEQPELHLHPRLQAKLADVFVNAIKAAKAVGIDLRIIIESHSEYMVNRLGLLVAKTLLESKDVSIYVFEKDKLAAPTTVRPSLFNTKGHLQNWPYGFFEPQL